MKITLDLTTEEVQRLVDTLDEYCDEGPFCEGWKSPTQKSLRGKVESAIVAAKQEQL